MTSLCTFPGALVRSIVIEQLNAGQWHATVQGGDVPAGSIEDLGTGVGPFSAAAARAIVVADITGLPVMVQPYNDAVQPLGCFAPSRAYWRQRFQGRSRLDHILYGSFGEGAA